MIEFSDTNTTGIKASNKLIAMFIAMLFVFGACTTGEIVDGSERSLPDIRTAIFATMGEPRSKSSNEREYLSVYFSRKKQPNFDPEKSKERAYAKMTILGDRRPYEVEVGVFLEERVDGAYEEVGLDEDLSIQIATEFKKALQKSRDQRNIIDDFRAF